MKLSEAIERGIAITAPLKGRYIDFKDGKKMACTLGCALFGGGGNPMDWRLPDGLKLTRAYPILHVPLTGISVPLPVELPRADSSYSLMCLIEALNDETSLIRSEINEWIKQVEEAMENEAN